MVNRALSDYVDGRLPNDQRHAVAWHLKRCEACNAASEQLLRLRATLQALPRPAPPAELSMALRLMASREAGRRGLGAVLGGWMDGFRFRLNGFMRPLALPFAGGLVSAILVFALFVPMYALPGNRAMGDVPTMLSTEATLKSVPSMDFSDEEMVVEVVVDDQGRIVDYSVPHGQGWLKNAQVRRNMENMLLFTSFTPGTAFGQPISTRIRLSFRRSQIDVKG